MSTTTTPRISILNCGNVAPSFQMRCATIAESSDVLASRIGVKANTLVLRKPRPPVRSGCSAFRRSGIRDTSHKKRYQTTTNRTTQRRARNRKSGRLTKAYQRPAGVSVDPSAAWWLYQVPTFNDTRDSHAHCPPMNATSNTAISSTEEFLSLRLETTA